LEVDVQQGNFKILWLLPQVLILFLVEKWILPSRSETAETGSIRVLGIEYRFFNADIVVLCILPRAPAVSTRSGSTFHPLALMSSIRPSYFTIFSFILFSEYLSLQYMNSMNCTVNVGLGWFGGSALYG
jgi:hypothetical protein